MTEAVRVIDECRLCRGRDLQLHIDFGRVPLGNNLQETAEAARRAESYPLTLRRCQACGHFQLGHAVAPELLYATNYTYLSGIGASFVRHFQDYAGWAEARCGLRPGSLVVDVGSNDGTCLQAFLDRGHRVCGVDPASLAAGIANDHGIETLNTFFDSEAVDEIVRRHGHADYVTSHNVLAHVDDLAAVFRNIHALLKDGGYFGFEVGYFRDVLSNGCFDTIYHEHLDYHHAAPLARHLTALGFDLVELGTNRVQGGSIRLLFRKTGEGKVTEQAAAFLAEEGTSVLYDQDFLGNWRRRIELAMAEFRRLLRARVDAGARIVGYGAPTKATLLLKMADLGADEFAFVVDDNPHKAGRFLPVSAIPIRPGAAIEAARPETVVIFAWNFADEIMDKLRTQFAGSVEAVVPLPELRVVTL